MPFAQITAATPAAERAALREQLTQEWQNRQSDLAEPVIIEERAQLYSDLLHLYVVWSRWAGMGQRERSSIIMEAYREAHPQHPDNILAVTVAMGLTPEEAQRMGIEYAPLSATA